MKNDPGKTLLFVAIFVLVIVAFWQDWHFRVLDWLGVLVWDG